MTDIPTPPSAAVAQWATALRAHGRRVTRQRLAVLAAVELSPHATTEDIAASVRVDLPEITVQSVYVVLADLTALGLLRRIETPHSPARYETRVDDNHHHAVCTGCGRIEDVDCAVGHAPCLTPQWPAGTSPMTIQIADVVYQGLCADCR
ncbi:MULTISPECIES: Fur family transcriptional regulator [unclassified Arthrobacter]|uniref:Fur family transcriptional regulator n=1 Tax=unclassified Arthrobacter TaxID=235627 RepID=UPI0014925DBB|nr:MULTISPECIES: Fur family transcriptional regulator [unclassified Arthrobacter]MBE0009419.1 transcriptional repressor [Arthrobacter sp. AET 35A]NOJ63532.1 transcriptional repressor [Arthrobacter sp. 147(2020)]